ncbi:MAG: hypothetical protein AABZ39_01660 [Spirochaetota bacterium]
MQKLIALMIAFTAMTTMVHAMPSYEDVLVVARQGNSESADIAAYFKNARGIPSVNVTTIPLASSSKADRDAFVLALSNYMVANGIWDRINYIVLSSGFPQTVQDVGGNCYLAAFIMYRLSGNNTKVIQNSPYAFCKTNNYYDRGDIKFSKRKYGYFIVSHLDGPGIIQIKKMIDSAGAADYDTYTSGVKFVYESIYPDNTLSNEMMLRGVNYQQYDYHKFGAVNNISGINFIYCDWVWATNGMNEDEIGGFPNVFKKLTFKPGGIMSVFRSFPTSGFRLPGGGLNKWNGGVFTPLRKSDSFDLKYLNQYSIDIDTAHDIIYTGHANPCATPYYQIASEDARGLGVTMYDKAGNLIKHFTKENTGGGLVSDAAEVIRYDQYNNRVWAGTFKGLCYYDIAADTWKAIPEFSSPTTNVQVYSIYVDPTTSGRYIYITFRAHRWVSILPPAIPVGEPARSDWLWLWEYDTLTKTYRKFDIDGSASVSSFYMKIVKTAANTVWAMYKHAGGGECFKIAKYDLSTLTTITNINLSNVIDNYQYNAFNAIAAASNGGFPQIFIPVGKKGSSTSKWTNGVLRITESTPSNFIFKTYFKSMEDGVYSSCVFVSRVNSNDVYMMTASTTSGCGSIFKFNDSNPNGIELRNGASALSGFINDAICDNRDDSVWVVSRNYTYQDNAHDFLDNNAMSVMGGNSHDTFYYDGAALSAAPSSDDIIPVSPTNPDSTIFVSSAVGSEIAPIATRLLDGMYLGEARSACRSMASQGGGGYVKHMFVMDPKSCPYAPRVNVAALDTSVTKVGGTYRMKVKLFSPMLDAARSWFIPSTITTNTVRLADSASNLIAPSEINYISNENAVEFVTTNTLPGGKYYLTLTCGIDGIKNSRGASLVNTRPDEFKDEITIEYTYANAPTVAGAPASAVTNSAFTVAFTVDQNYGYFSTNGTAFTQFAAPGTNVRISTTTTLFWYGCNIWGNMSVTNSASYTFDTNAPVVTGAPASFTTNAAFIVNLAVSENFGYWSTNGAAFVSFTAAGAVIPVNTTTTLRCYGRDAIGNTSSTNTYTYVIGAGLPNTPISLAAAAIDGNSIGLSWHDSSSNETMFRIYRSTNDAAYSLAATVPANTTNYDDCGLAGGVRYFYRLSAMNAAGESAQAGPASAFCAITLSLLNAAVILMPVENKVQFMYTLVKSIITSASLAFDLSPAGASTYLPLPGTIEGPCIAASGGDLVNTWTIPAGFDISRRYDLRITADIAAVTNAVTVVSNVDITRMFSTTSNLNYACALNNPYRGSGDILFANIPSDTTLKVYTLSGRCIVSMPAPSDGSRLAWNALTATGKKAAPGVYLCRLSSYSGTRVLKVMIVR